MISPNLSNVYISKYVSSSSRSFGNRKTTCLIPVYMTGALEMTSVFDRHYGLKMHFSSKKLLFGRFIGQKVRFQTIVPVKKTCHLRVWGKSPFDFQNFEKILRHILKYRNCSNLEGSLLSTIWSYGGKLPDFFSDLSGYYSPSSFGNLFSKIMKIHFSLFTITPQK